MRSPKSSPTRSSPRNTSSRAFSTAGWPKLSPPPSPRRRAGPESRAPTSHWTEQPRWSRQATAAACSGSRPAAHDYRLPPTAYRLALRLPLQRLGEHGLPVANPISGNRPERRIAVVVDREGADRAAEAARVEGLPDHVVAPVPLAACPLDRIQQQRHRRVPVRRE